jgi:mRNA interferase RelE/StbE
MKLIRTDRFLRDYRKLPAQVRRHTERKLLYLVQDIGHPSLRVRRVRKYADVYEASITMQYRLLFQITAEAYVLLRIGRHDILEKL